MVNLLQSISGVSPGEVNLSLYLVMHFPLNPIKKFPFPLFQSLIKHINNGVILT